MNGLTITAPAGALCGLYRNAPAARNFDVIDPINAIPANEVTTKDGITTYYYANLDFGLYHCAASMEGCYSLCQMVNYTGSTQLTMQLEPLAGNGYDAGFVMRCTPEFENQALASSADTWGPAYAKLFCTPWFLPCRPSRHQQTTNEELADFIQKLKETSKNMYTFSLGKSPKYGFDMPLVLFTREPVAGMTLERAAQIVRSNGKPTIQYCAQCHSTEPASCEGALTMIASLCGDYGKILDSVDIYIIPRINPDGAYEVTRYSPTTGEDMNRDYLYMHNKEIRMVATAYNLFRPEVAIDGHERIQSALSANDNICTDVELQTGAGSLNHPAAMTELTMKMATKALENAKSLGLRGHFYAKLASAAGGAAGSSYFGTRNSLSFLIETPGQATVGGSYLERRVVAHYAAASAIIDYTVQYADEILTTVHNSREYMRVTGPIYDETDMIVLEHGATQTGVWGSTLLRTATGEVIDPNYTVAYKEHTESLMTRPRATAYVLPIGLQQEDEILRVAQNHALDYYLLPPCSTVPLQQYMQIEEKIKLVEEKLIPFDKGALVFPNTVDSTILGVIMEPDFNPSQPNRKMTLLRMGLLTADAMGHLPLYRYCHNLKDGKLADN